MRRRTSSLAVRAAAWAAATVAVVSAVTHGDAGATTYTHGWDISWPQCSNGGDGSRAAHLPSGGTYVILGLTHGAGHTTNPCLAGQLSWAKSHNVLVGAYLVPSYPTPGQLSRASTGAYGECASADTACRAANDGYRQGTDALRVMRKAGLPAPMVWVDVEFRHQYPWSKNQAVNARVVAGVIARLQAEHLNVGIYTTSYMWQHIVGDYRVDLPNWLPAGSGKPDDAKAKCGATGSGGRPWLVQYTRSFDENLTCPVMDATPGEPGPLWPYRTTTLTVGSSGAAVVALQKALAVSQVTGVYDAATTAAVLQFQVAKGLPVNGIVDEDDWRALGAFTLVGAHGFWLPLVVAPAS